MRPVGFLLLLLATSLSIAARGQEAPLFPTPIGQAAVQTAAESIAEAYVAIVDEVLERQTTRPALEVRDSPYLAYFDPRESKIVVPFWPPKKASTFGFFLALADGDTAWAEVFFEELFDWFLVAHELTHWLQTELGLSPSHYESETMADDFAVAFHMGTSGGEERLLHLDRMLVQALEHLTDPGPQGIETTTYFNAFYMALTQDPWKYGYYQFGFIRDSIARRNDLSLVDLLAEIAHASGGE
jgi:hypothetical protein